MFRLMIMRTRTFAHQTMLKTSPTPKVIVTIAAIVTGEPTRFSVKFSKTSMSMATLPPVLTICFQRTPI